MILFIYFSASKFLMPLSFGTILAGMTTQIGTSTNMVAFGLLKEYNGEVWNLFEIGL